MDSFYIWLDWSIAWSSAAPYGLSSCFPTSALRIVLLMAKTKIIQSYSIIWNIRTAWPPSIPLGYYSLHVEDPQQQ